MQRFAMCIGMTIAVLAFAAHAEPLSVSIEDHDFTFHVPYFLDPETGNVASAVYEFNGANPDTIRLTSNLNRGEQVAGTHNVGSYSYAGNSSQVPPGLAPLNTPPTASQWLYPVFYSGQWDGKLELEMSFDAADGPYTNPAGDQFEISLEGQSATDPVGLLRISGGIGQQGLGAGALYPNDATDLVPLFEIEFSKVTLLARAGHETADLVEGVGQVTHAMGYTADELIDLLDDVDSPEDLTAVTFFKFMLPDDEDELFPQIAGANYHPLSDFDLDRKYGAISGETGAGGAVPEPATMSLLALGGLGVLLRRRRR
ncbi:MAG: PEP-CTERM sorting domain-containing protein [Phycisphaerae bacterium]|nr:PEP-CTERM sorting domain-containing protein [Phycisphaerae bacterium]